MNIQDKVTQARQRARDRFKHLATMSDRPKPLPVDPENPPLTDSELARLRPSIEVHPKLVRAKLR